MGVKKKTIKVLTDVISYGGNNYPTYAYHDISMSKVSRYGGSLKVLTKLSGKEIIFLEYLTEVMDGDNLIVNNLKLRDDFMFYMAQVECEGYSHGFLRNIISKLVKFEVLIANGRRGTYHVNPLYYSKNSDGRERLIKKLAENKLLTLDK